MAEKRLIDANALKVKAFADPDSGEGFVYVQDIDEAQTVDAVEVVRCKDCTKNGLFTCPICYIENKTLQFINLSPDFFCGEGERKEGDGNG